VEPYLEMGGGDLNVIQSSLNSTVVVVVVSLVVVLSLVVVSLVVVASLVIIVSLVVCCITSSLLYH
jgi:hypothetical protein